MKSYFNENHEDVETMSLWTRSFPPAIPSIPRFATTIRPGISTAQRSATSWLPTAASSRVRWENSILFRGVRVGKGAWVKNCVLMQDTVIEADAGVEYVVTDKNATYYKGQNYKRHLVTFPGVRGRSIRLL